MLIFTLFLQVILNFCTIEIWNENKVNQTGVPKTDGLPILAKIFYFNLLLLDVTPKKQKRKF